MRICVRDAGMPRKDFLRAFLRAKLTSRGSTSTFVRSASTHRRLAKLKDEILRAQRKLLPGRS